MRIREGQNKFGPPKRICRFCGKQLWPWYCNMTIHPRCKEAYRKKYFREYQRKARREMRAYDL